MSPVVLKYDMIEIRRIGFPRAFMDLGVGGVQKRSETYLATTIK